MKNNFTFLALLLIVIFGSSCSETGLEGPEGPAGAQGKTGEAGAVGPGGKDGSIMYSGAGVPANTIGVNGDYYLDKNTGNLYGPKVAGAWGTPTVLRGTNGTNGTNGAAGSNGTNGTNGTNGSTTLNGNGTPSASTGIVGDYFLDKANYMLYGPKTAAGWGIPILLKGADGTQGPTGPAGKDGSIIYSGSGSPLSTIGTNGDYYLNKNNGDLYGPKTVAGWGLPIVLKGTNGTNGTNGANGTAGANGTNGANGSVTHSGLGSPDLSTGTNGDYYLDRTGFLLYGPKNADGWGTGILLRGADGAQGPMGPAGADGTIIHGGDYYPDASLGKIGDFFISRFQMEIYGPKTASGWGTGRSLRGTDGINGTNGTNGSSIRNGVGVPASSLGVDGDFYIDVATYMIYGPKASGAWGTGTSLKGADGTGTSNLLFETPDNTTFSWGYEYSYYGGRRHLKMHRNGNYNDSTSVYSVPASAVATAQNSIMLVYMRDATNGWKQIVEADTTYNGTYSKSRITPTTASARIIETNAYAFPPTINKVRIVLVPYTNGGALNYKGKDDGTPIIPMNQVLQKLNLREKDFIKLK